MTAAKTADTPASVRPFRFESYGVLIEICSNDASLVAEAAAIMRSSLLGHVREMPERAMEHRFDLNKTSGGTYILLQDGKRLASGRGRKKFLRLVDSIVSMTVGEFAVDRVFMHAGVVGWKGKAIIIPANSFQGKTTLVAELVRRGGSYYSDEFAIFDKEGRVHPFSRPLALRDRSREKMRIHEMTATELGGTYGVEPIEVGLVLLASYVEGARWSPRLLSPGAGVLEMMPHTLPLRHRPQFTLEVLNKIARRAIIAKSRRGNAEKFAQTLLKFVDKHGN